MTKSIECETATLADAVIRAARLAPSKGAAYDKAAGVLIDVLPTNGFPVRVSATDLEVSYYQRMTAVDVGDEPVSWRLPSQLISGYLSNLPLSTGKTVKLYEEDGILHLKAGRGHSKFRMLPADLYPRIKGFDPTGLEEVPGFARRIEQVAWACANDNPPLTGIHIDGALLSATDRYRVALVPCTVPVTKSVTAPLGPLLSVLRNVDDVKLRATDLRLELMPDPDTQLTAMVYQEAYPDIASVLDRCKIETELVIEKAKLIEVIDRMLVLVKGERYPRMNLTFKADTIGIEMTLPDVGEMTDEIDCKHGPLDEVTTTFDPMKLKNAVANTSRETATIGLTENPLHPTKIYDESGFDSYLMPMVDR